MVAPDQQILNAPQKPAACPSSIRARWQSLIIAVIAFAAMACNSNHGDIGHLYGEWGLQEMTVGGAQADIDCSDYYWRFQSNVLCITIKMPYNEFNSYFGSWEISDDNELLVNFSYAPGNADFSPFFPPPGMYLSGTELNIMKIEAISGKEMKLRFVSEDGHPIVYRFRKIN